MMMVLSLVTLGSFSYHDDPQFGHLYKQIVWFVVGVAVFLLLVSFDYRVFVNYSWGVMGVYVFSIILLLITFFMPSIRGSQSWILFGPFQFQPVEFVKLALLLVLSKYFSRRHIEIARSSVWTGALVYAAVPMGLVALQPDLGSAFILTLVWFILTLSSGVRTKHLVFILLVCIVAAGILWGTFLEDYQKARITSFLFPNNDPLGASYNVIQSKIAIGSAGLLGKGLGKGSQVQYGFLPEAKTDFIFAGFIEEWGIVGGVAIIAVFALIVARMLYVTPRVDNNFAKLFCLGAAGLFTVQFFLNAGSNVGILPVTGVTFPLFSYGGSSVVMSMAILGVVESMYVRLGKKYGED